MSISKLYPEIATVLGLQPNPGLMQGCSFPKQPPKRHKEQWREVLASSYGNGEGHCKCRYSGLLSRVLGEGQAGLQAREGKLSSVTEDPLSTPSSPSLPRISLHQQSPTGHYDQLASSHVTSELHRFPHVLPADSQNSSKSLHIPPCQSPKASSAPQPHIHLSLTSARPNFTKTSQYI